MNSIKPLGSKYYIRGDIPLKLLIKLIPITPKPDTNITNPYNIYESIFI